MRSKNPISDSNPCCVAALYVLQLALYRRFPSALQILLRTLPCWRQWVLCNCLKKASTMEDNSRIWVTTCAGFDNVNKDTCLILTLKDTHDLKSSALVSWMIFSSVSQPIANPGRFINNSVQVRNVCCQNLCRLTPSQEHISSGTKFNYRGFRNLFRIQMLNALKMVL